MTPEIVTAERARLLLMGAQGLLDDPARRATPSVLRKLVERIGFVQLDSINVVERAQHLTLGSRLDNYRHEHFTSLLETERSLFEHWTHDASAIPVKWYMHWKPRFEREKVRIRQNTWWNERMGENADKIIDEVRERIVREGPLRSQEFEHDRRGESSAWWGWKPQKAALEFLWRTGELMVARRHNFQKVYDLTERVMPAVQSGPHPSEREHIEWACQTALERLAVATPREIAEFWDAINIAQASAWCAEALAEGRINRVLVESKEGSKPKQGFAVLDWKQRSERLQAPPARMRLLSPFDPVLRDRRRALRLFGFDYRFEAFVPEAKRQYGYYVLPILEGDQLVGRLDPKFERSESLLKIRAVYWEQGVRVTKLRRRALARALEQLAQLINARRVALPE
jgi:uncharacterized protein YcaQ